MRTLKFPVVTTVAVLALFALASIGRACFLHSPQPAQVWLDHIHVEITDQVAVKTYNCTFKNLNSQAIVGGTCYMELEPGAQVDDMSVTVDGKEMKAEILDVDKANQVFADIVKNGGSPALLEYYGNQLIQTKVPRIAPNGTVTVKLKYTTVLKPRDGLVRLQMLNTNPKALMQPLQSAGVTVNIRSSQPLKNIYSPTHEIKLVEKDDWDIAVEWKQENYLPKHPFVLYYQTSPSEVGASLIAHRELDEPGTFMLMLSPTIGRSEQESASRRFLPKDIVFCVDTSGSMLQNGLMEQARGALRYCIENLRPGDRFNIVDFGTTVREFKNGGLARFDHSSKARALRYIDNLSARGGTAIQEALDVALDQLESVDRLKMIVFATDGLPTIGERDPDAILKHVARKNTNDVRIFVFGEGYGVNTKLLDFLALDHRGEADYILPDEDITEKIGRLFDRVGSPTLTELKVTFDGLEVTDVYPRSVPDVFQGEQVILFGRYSGHGTKTVTVTANAAGEKKTFTYELEFPEFSEDDKHAFVPRLWAGKKVDFLLSELRKSETMEDELVDEVTYLAKRYGIVTPYTSYLVADDALAATPGSSGAEREQLGARLQFYYSQVGGYGAGAALPDAAAPQQNVESSKQQAQFRRAFNSSGGYGAFYDQAELELKKQNRSESALAAIHCVGTRTFYKRGAEWHDCDFDPAKDKDVQSIEVGSERYLSLIRENPRLAKYLALGQVVVQVKDQWYRFEPQKRG